MHTRYLRFLLPSRSPSSGSGGQPNPTLVFLPHLAPPWPPPLPPAPAAVAAPQPVEWRRGLRLAGAPFLRAGQGCIGGAPGMAADHGGVAGGWPSWAKWRSQRRRAATADASSRRDAAARRSGLGPTWDRSGPTGPFRANQPWCP
jgi:hypothetical protein